MEEIKRQLEVAKSNGNTKLVGKLREKVWRLRDSDKSKSKPNQNHRNWQKGKDIKELLKKQSHITTTTTNTKTWKNQYNKNSNNYNIKYKNNINCNTKTNG